MAAPMPWPAPVTMATLLSSALPLNMSFAPDVERVAAKMAHRFDDKPNGRLLDFNDATDWRRAPGAQPSQGSHASDRPSRLRRPGTIRLRRGAGAAARQRRLLPRRAGAPGPLSAHQG